MRKLIGLILIVFVSLFISASSIKADELSDIQNEINKLQEQLDASRDATTPLETEVQSLNAQISSLDARLVEIKKDLAQSEEDLAHQKKVLAATVRKFYIESFVNIPLLTFFTSGNAAETLKLITFQQNSSKTDRSIISSITEKVAKLEIFVNIPLLTFFTSGNAAETLKLITFQQNSSKTDRSIISSITEKVAKLAEDNIRFAAAQSQLDKQRQVLRGEIASAKSFQSEVQGKIAALSARQQEILSSRLSSLNLPRSAATSASGCTDDRAVNPGFSPRFAFYSFGVPNRVGLNQYGAKGRAEAGQNHEQILNAYYQGINFETRSNINISVDGYEEMPLETYMLGIYEVPDSWPMEVLKAQAIAARSYAFSYTNNGTKSICTSQNCQVYKGGNKGGNWEQAVKATEGKVMTNGGNVITAWYSSTHGGDGFMAGEIGWSGKPRTKAATHRTSGAGN